MAELIKRITEKSKEKPWFHTGTTADSLMQARKEYAEVISPRKAGSGLPCDSVWLTQDGREVRVADMGDRHLLNTIRFIERNRQAYAFKEAISCMRCSIQVGTMAKFALEQEINFLLYSDDAYPYVYYDMLEEAEQRSLQ